MGAYNSCKKNVSTEFKAITDSSDIHFHYYIGNVLGYGSFGEVRKCTHKVSGKVYAVKIMPRRGVDTGEWSNEQIFLREIQFLQILDHPSIIKFYKFYRSTNYLYAILEYCNEGKSLSSLQKYKSFDEKAIAFVIHQLLQALNYLHSKNIMHRDIKIDNVLIKNESSINDENLLTAQIKLIDFGMATILPKEKAYLTNICGSPKYLAPELIKAKYNTKADMWALGVICYLLLYKAFPFSGKNTKSIIKNIRLKKINRITASQISEDAADFLNKLLEWDSIQRFSAASALNHKWILDAVDTI